MRGLPARLANEQSGGRGSMNAGQMATRAGRSRCRCAAPRGRASCWLFTTTRPLASGHTTGERSSHQYPPHVRVSHRPNETGSYWEVGSEAQLPHIDPYTLFVIISTVSEVRARHWSAYSAPPHERHSITSHIHNTMPARPVLTVPVLRRRSRDASSTLASWTCSTDADALGTQRSSADAARDCRSCAAGQPAAALARTP